MRGCSYTTVFICVYTIIWAVVAAHLGFFALLTSVIPSPGLRASFLADPPSNFAGWWLFAIVNDVLDGTVYAFRLIVPLSALVLGLLSNHLSKDYMTTRNVLLMGLALGLIQSGFVPWLIPPLEHAGPFQDRWVAVFVVPTSSAAASLIAARVAERDDYFEKKKR